MSAFQFASLPRFSPSETGLRNRLIGSDIAEKKSPSAVQVSRRVPCLSFVPRTVCTPVASALDRVSRSGPEPASAKSTLESVFQNLRRAARMKTQSRIAERLVHLSARTSADTSVLRQSPRQFVRLHSVELRSSGPQVSVLRPPVPVACVASVLSRVQ